MSDAAQTAAQAAALHDARLMRLATYASLGVAVALVALKTGAWMITGAVSMLSTLADSVLDAGASLINLLAVYHALQPADREHRWGHGKAEALAGLGQAAFIAGSGLFLLLEAAGRIVAPRPVQESAWGIAVMVIAIAATLALVLFQIMVARRTRSLAIRSDSFHYQTDLVSNLAVIGSLILSGWFSIHYADPVVALGIVAYMAWGSIGIARQALDELMDRELPDADRQKIREIAQRHPAVKAVHDLRTRSSGRQNFIQIHLEMDRDLTLVEAHEISDEVMYNVEAAFPNSEVLIHQDPEGVEERRDVLASPGRTEAAMGAAKTGTQ
jgi:ferrous-iron efflux pump FieF